MGKFKKQIVSSGKYHVSTPDDNHPEVMITPERIRGWANTLKELLAAGHKIPAPFRHDLNAIPLTEGNNGTLETSFENGGYWTDFEVEVNEDNVPVLMGHLETPYEEKVGKTIKDVSIYVKPEWKDGKGRVWRDVPMHVAIVTHPIEPGQPNFEPVENDTVIAMSHIAMAMTDDYTMVPVGSSLTAIIKDLRDVASIDLGDDTTCENIVERLHVALRQKRISEQSGQGSAGSVSKPPEGAVRESVPIQMSLEQKNETVDQVETDEVKALKQQNEALLMSVTTNKKVSLEARVNALLQSKRITEAYALELKKALEGFQMSFNADGSEVVSTTECIIKAFEDGAEASAQKSATHPGEPLVMSSLPPGHQLEVKDEEQDLSPERIAELTNSFMTRTR